MRTAEIEMQSLSRLGTAKAERGIRKCSFVNMKIYTHIFTDRAEQPCLLSEQRRNPSEVEEEHIKQRRTEETFSPSLLATRSRNSNKSKKDKNKK